MEGRDSIADSGENSAANLTDTSASTAAVLSNPSIPAFTSDITKMDLDVLPDFGNTDHDFFEMGNAFGTNTDHILGTHDSLQDMVDQARTQLQERMNAMGSAPSTGGLVGDGLGVSELLTPEVGIANQGLGFAHDDSEDSSETNEAYVLPFFAINKCGRKLTSLQF